MEQEIIDLKEEVNLLTQRIEELEKTENRRKAFFYVKLLIKIILILASVYAIWRGYQYLSDELPGVLEEKIQEINPVKKK